MNSSLVPSGEKTVPPIEAPLGAFAATSVLRREPSSSPLPALGEGLGARTNRLGIRSFYGRQLAASDPFRMTEKPSPSGERFRGASYSTAASLLQSGRDPAPGTA